MRTPSTSIYSSLGLDRPRASKTLATVALCRVHSCTRRERTCTVQCPYALVEFLGEARTHTMAPISHGQPLHQPTMPIAPTD
eukprot:740545-Pleurochrysis_carterae.AAC.2